MCSARQKYLTSKYSEVEVINGIRITPMFDNTKYNLDVIALILCFLRFTMMFSSVSILSQTLKFKNVSEKVGFQYQSLLRIKIISKKGRELFVSIPTLNCNFTRKLLKVYQFISGHNRQSNLLKKGTPKPS